jgi:hypothetical protein
LLLNEVSSAETPLDNDDDDAAGTVLPHELPNEIFDLNAFGFTESFGARNAVRLVLEAKKLVDEFGVSSIIEDLIEGELLCEMHDVKRSRRYVRRETEKEKVEAMSCSPLTMTERRVMNVATT